MTFSLHADIASSGWHTSIATTYAVDGTFYDLCLERRLRKHGSRNNILMADARMLKQALLSDSAGFAAAGSRYVVVPVKVRGAFHPKIHLRFGEDKARLILGSANVTAAGWGCNQEVVSTIEWRAKGAEASDNDAMGSLIARAYAYLLPWLIQQSGDAVPYKLQLMRSKSRWLKDLDPYRGLVELRDGSSADILCESGGRTPSILRQFVDYVSDDDVVRLVVVSPYWDSDLQGFRALRTALGSPVTFVVLNPKTNEFPLAALTKKDDLSFVSFEGSDPDRFLHAKMILVEGRQATHVLFGSPNCSDDALGLVSSAGRNAEAAIYRRYPGRTVLADLGIDLRRKVARGDISVPSREPERDSREASVPAGYMELNGRTLTWWPPESPTGEGAVILIGAAEFAPQAVAARKWVAELASDPAYPVIAQVRYSNGRLSDPSIVHGQEKLKRAAPAGVAAGLSDALAKIRRGEGDLLDLASQAHVLFAPDPGSDVPLRTRIGGKRARNAEPPPEQFSSPEAFRQALSMRAATGRAGIFANQEPGLSEVLSIAVHGMSGSLPIDDVEDVSDDEGLLAGESEDDVGEEDDRDEERSPTSASQPSPAPPPKKNREFTSEEVLKRRAQLLRALDKFVHLLNRLRSNPSEISTRIAGQTVFVFWLMRYGHRFLHIGAEGDKRLLVLAPTHGGQRSYSFALRSIFILTQLWRGKSPLASFLHVDRKHGELQDDLFWLVVVSRWAVVRSYLASAALGTENELAERLKVAAREIYLASDRIGLVDDDAQTKSMEELDADLGCNPAETRVLLDHNQSLMLLVRQEREKVLPRARLARAAGR